MAFRLTASPRSPDDAPERAHQRLLAPVEAKAPPQLGGDPADPHPPAPAHPEPVEGAADATEPERIPAPFRDPFESRASIPATYRSNRLRVEHRYRGAALLALLLLGLAAATWFAAAEALRAIEQGAAALRAGENEQRRAIAATALVTAALLSLIIAWGRATAPRRAVRLADGRGRIAVETIAARLRATIEAHPDAHEARVWVENRHRRGVRIDVRLRVGARARIDDTLDAVDEAAEELVHRRLGVSMDGPPLVDVTYDELDLRAGRAHG